MRKFEIDTPRLIFHTLTVLIAVMLVLRLFQLQLLEGGRFMKLSIGNAARLIPAAAPRGIIYDRYGKVIVANRPIFSLMLIPPNVADMDQTVAYLNAVTHVPRRVIIQRMEDKKSRPFEPVLVADNIPPQMVSQLEEERYKYPGVVVSVRSVRSYPSGPAAVHAIGYVGEITQEELAQLEERGYRIGSLIGKAGLEKQYDSYLRGKDGGTEIEVDAAGQPVRILRYTEPISGKDLWLTIDVELQRAVEKALRGKYGAIVVMDPNNGEILAMASYPAFDPNLFSAPLTQWQWESISRYGHPFMNRALSPYPAGSTFKPITQSAVLEDNLVEPTRSFYCPGYFKLGTRTAFCWNRKGHGWQDLAGGIRWSCNIVHYNLGLIAGPDRLAKYARKYGLGRRTGIDLPGESEGTVPDSRWKEKVYGEIWYPGDTINFAIGQGFFQSTPLQMASFYSLLANGREAYVPYIVREIKDRQGNVVYSRNPIVRMELPISQKNLTFLRNALRSVVEKGTGIAAKVRGIPAAGKTGTAEDPPGAPHAWFDCYAPYDKPEITIVAFAEGGMHGDQVTAFMARDILKWYKENRLKRKIEE